MRVFALLACAAMALLAPARPGFACSCIEQSPSSYMNGAAAAFVGTVTVVDRGTQIAIATLDVRTIFKGAIGRIVHVQTGGSGDTCGIGFVEGTSYLVFAAMNGSELSTGLCSGTTDDTELLTRSGVRALTTHSPAARESPRAAADIPVERSRTAPLAAALAAVIMSGAAWVVFRPA